MKNIIFSSLSLILIAMSLCVNYAFMRSDRTGIINDTVPTNYHLVWSDEFNIPGPPDSTKWGYETGYARNEEIQWYQKPNTWCENGNLIIEGRKETRPNPTYKAGSKDWRTSRPDIEYTSSSINTRKTAGWLYGRFEMRGNIDISSGLWPAWWTLGIAEEWPANGEIDIMEYYKGQLLANIANLGPNGKPGWFTTKRPVDSMGGKSWASKFHTWRMDWNEKEISLYVDDVLLNRVTMDRLTNGDASGKNPFKQKHYMLLNMAMGGINGGSLAGTVFPNRFEVDYVRVYQLSKK